jgi:hypothetical protein
MNHPILSHKGLAAPSHLIIGTVLWFAIANAEARIDLSPLERDGYGFTELKRPQPNVLTVLATIDGRRANLVVDTGWSAEGITLERDYAQRLHLATEPVKRFGQAAGGKELSGVTKGRSEKVSIGNVEIHGVPLFFGNFGSFQKSEMEIAVGNAGYLGAGFLRACSGIVDLHNLRLYLRPPGTGHRAMIGAALKEAGLAEVPFAITQNNVCIVEVEINGAPGKMILDTGDYLAEADSRFASQMKVAAYNTNTGSIDAAGVQERTHLAHLRSFKIGGVNVRAPDLRLGTFAAYSATGGKLIGALGMDILGRNGAIIDLGQQKLYFYPL